MILDSSALVAIVLREPVAHDLLSRMREASHLGIGAATLLEVRTRWQSLRKYRGCVSVTPFHKPIACSLDQI